MLEKSDIFKVDGVALYQPSKNATQTMPVHDPDSGTDENEDMHLIVKGFRRKATITYDKITGTELKEILKLLIKKVNYYQFTYKDPLLGISTIEAYVPDYSIDALNYAIGNAGDDGVYESVSLEFIGSRLMDY